MSDSFTKFGYTVVVVAPTVALVVVAPAESFDREELHSSNFIPLLSLLDGELRWRGASFQQLQAVVVAPAGSSEDGSKEKEAKGNQKSAVASPVDLVPEEPENIPEKKMTERR
ncbi:hypothetical protein L6452_31776 [Arctium lappa]|uniref:Uncharacterized protein n=1 Tax=Arctium lappa TaxID=4217 RepID=A0ACB8Z1X8_ARCLA|nr:hypothetical protein L6452_31776 [Arctium lappa]